MLTPGLRKYACDLTLDPNTAHSELSVSHDDRQVTRGNASHPYPDYSVSNSNRQAQHPTASPDHPDRFDWGHQVLCREGLSGRCYWEAEWRGMRIDIVVCVKRRPSKRGDNTQHDSDDKSWSLYCRPDTPQPFAAIHNNTHTLIAAPSSSSSSSSSRSRRVGVYLDRHQGTLSFYSVSSDAATLTHLHTFTAAFTEPLYAGFRLRSHNSSVTLCQIT